MFDSNKSRQKTLEENGKKQIWLDKKLVKNYSILDEYEIEQIQVNIKLTKKGLHLSKIIKLKNLI